MRLIVLVGPPGSGKSTKAKELEAEGYRRVSTDDQGKVGQKYIFEQALLAEEDIVVDRMNFNKEQRDRYLIPAKAAGYTTEIQVFHESYATCLARCNARAGHPTIKTEADAEKALHFFFTKYERVQDDEASIVIRHWPAHAKPLAVICDLDGTLCNCEHRQHHVRNGNKNWKGFFEAMDKDLLNTWCYDIINSFYGTSLNGAVVLCSGRGAEYRDKTEAWLADNSVGYHALFMRREGDYRQDFIVKEIILDFEILTRFKPFYAIDDRKQIVDMWRRRGITCLQCAEGNF